MLNDASSNRIAVIPRGNRAKVRLGQESRRKLSEKRSNGRIARCSFDALKAKGDGNLVGQDPEKADHSPRQACSPEPPNLTLDTARRLLAAILR